MSKKTMLLALAAVTAVLALPATASALQPLHLSPTPATGTIDSVGKGILTTSGSSTRVECAGFGGTAVFGAGGTTGTATLKFGEGCTTSLGGTCTNGGHTSSITTTTLPFHLVTVGGKPGVLFTPAEGSEHFATFTCHGVGGFLTVESVVKGNGVIGTITAPACDGEANEATISFTGKEGIQTHTKVDGTETVYTLKKGTETASQEAHGKLTLKDSKGVAVSSKLVCT